MVIIPQDVALRDRAASVCSLLRRGSPEHRFYESLQTEAVANIRETQAKDKEMLGYPSIRQLAPADLPGLGEQNIEMVNAFRPKSLSHSCRLFLFSVARNGPLVRVRLCPQVAIL